MLLAAGFAGGHFWAATGHVHRKA